MGLFNFFRKSKEGKATNFDEIKALEEKKEEKTVDFDEIKAFSFVAIDLAIPHIESTGSFLPFGGVLTNRRKV